MRLYLAQEPFEPDAVRVPSPCADQGKVVFHRALLRGLRPARRDERHCRKPIRAEAERRAVILGKSEDEAGIPDETAFQSLQNMGFATEQEFLDETSCVGGVFFRRAILHIMRHEQRGLVLEDVFKCTGQGHAVQHIGIERADLGDGRAQCLSWYHPQLRRGNREAGQEGFQHPADLALDTRAFGPYFDFAQNDSIRGIGFHARPCEAKNGHLCSRTTQAVDHGGVCHFIAGGRYSVRNNRCHENKVRGRQFNS